MRTIDEVKRDQDLALMELGFHVVKSEQAKAKVLKLAQEADDIESFEAEPIEREPEPHLG